MKIWDALSRFLCVLVRGLGHSHIPSRSIILHTHTFLARQPWGFFDPNPNTTVLYSYYVGVQDTGNSVFRLPPQEYSLVHFDLSIHLMICSVVCIGVLCAEPDHCIDPQTELIGAYRGP